MNNLNKKDLNKKNNNITVDNNINGILTALLIFIILVSIWSYFTFIKS